MRRREVGETIKKYEIVLDRPIIQDERFWKILTSLPPNSRKFITTTPTFHVSDANSLYVVFMVMIL